MENKSKKVLTTGTVIICLILLIFAALQLSGCSGPKELPKPEITGGARGEMGIDKNVNESTIDDYLGRDEAVYRDMRMLEDPAQYENIGGDRFLSGYVEGFEVVPLPYIIPIYGLPSAVGETYSGETLFSNYGGVYIPNYEESMSIIEEIFPKDKVIFLMCGGGGYAGMTRNFLVSMGWDPDKIYNAGGYWFYKGKNNIEVKKEENGKVTYDFESVPYHNIDFSKLTPLEFDEEAFEKQEVAVTDLILSTEKIELEEDTSYQLNAIILPNEAGGKELSWASSDSSIAYMYGYGLVRGVKPGTTTVTVSSSDGSVTASCEVTVTERADTEHVKLDDLSKEAETFAANNPNAIMHEFGKIDEDMEKAAKDGYYESDGEGGYTATDLWREEYERYSAEADKAIGVRTEILNKLAKEKRSFILLIYTKDCEGRTYHATEGAEKVLKESGIPYFYTNDMVSEFDRSLYDSVLDYEKAVQSSIVIYKEGEIYAGLNPDVDAIKSDEEVRNWLKKYIDLD